MKTIPLTQGLVAIVDDGQNIRNSKVRSDSISSLKGAQFRKDCGKYRAVIRRDGKRLNLGVYNTAAEAHAAYCDAAKKIYGEFARFN